MSSADFWGNNDFFEMLLFTLTHFIRVEINVNTGTKQVNPVLPNVAFHIETSHLFCTANQMTGSYIKRNTDLKWVKFNNCNSDVQSS